LTLRVRYKDLCYLNNFSFLPLLLDVFKLIRKKAQLFPNGL
jgi:hypothetical protein